MVHNRKRLFLENIFIYGLGSVMNKIIPLIMLPIISRLLPGTEYYGINDSVNIFIAFGSAIVMMGMFDAMYRFYFDKNDQQYHKEICTSTLFFVIFSGFIFFILVYIFRLFISKLIFSNSAYTALVIIGILTIWASNINTIVSAPTRMKNQRIRFILLQTIIPIISYGISLTLIYRGEYIYALPMATLASNVFSCILFYILNRKDFDVKCFNIKIIQPMLKFGLPLMPVFVFFWVLSSVGRIMITNIWGLEYTGIYGGANKLASTSQLIYAAFAGGWQYFAFSTMNDKDYISLITKVFEYLLGISFFATCLLILFIKPIFNIMLPSGYLDGIIIVPALFISPLILMLRQTIGMHFQVNKKSLYGTITIGFGAIVALILYYILIPILGIVGAALGSLLGYISSLLVTIIILIRMKLIYISKRVYILSFIMILILVLYMININEIINCLGAALGCIILVLFYYKDLYKLIANLLKRRENKL
jgi:O-antigen/teichoic acid export membrane protein